MVNSVTARSPGHEVVQQAQVISPTVSCLTGILRLADVLLLPWYRRVWPYMFSSDQRTLFTNYRSSFRYFILNLPCSLYVNFVANRLSPDNHVKDHTLVFVCLHTVINPNTHKLTEPYRVSVQVFELFLSLPLGQICWEGCQLLGGLGIIYFIFALANNRSLIIE